MVIPGCRHTLALLLAFYLAHAHTHRGFADEAVTRTGLRHGGTLRKQGFLDSKTGKAMALDQIHMVHFPEFPPPLARCPVAHQLLLPGPQHLSGKLLAVGEKALRFRVSTGEVLTLTRGQAQGVAQANDFLAQWAEDFEEPASGVWSGQPTFSEKHVFSGKRSLFVRAAAPAGLDVPTPRKAGRAYRATLHFFDSGPGKAAVARVEWSFQKNGASAAAVVVLSDKHYGLENGGTSPLRASPGWHVMQLDWSGEQASVFVDDFFLDSRPIATDARLAAVRFSCTGAGGIWIDALRVCETAPPAQRAPGPPDVDEIWLGSGDQLFGRIVGADERAITLEAPFGRRTIAWSTARGVFFRAEGKLPPPERLVDVWFRSGPAVVDQLKGEILELDENRLLLRHALLGEMGIARTRLQRIRFSEPAEKQSRPFGPKEQMPLPTR